MSNEESCSYTNSQDLLNLIFDKELSNTKKYDNDVVICFKKHLGQVSIRSNAGKELAKDLILLAKQRVEEGKK